MANFQSNINNTFYAILVVNQGSQNIPNNYTDVNYELILYNGSMSFSGYTIGYDVYINGEQVAYQNNSGNQTSMSAHSSKSIVSGTRRIYHNADGTKTIPISFRIFTDNRYFLPVELNASGNMDLTRIPRQANITSANDFNSNQNPSMSFNNPGGFSLNLRLEIPGATINRNNISSGGGNYTFELTETERNLLYSKCPNSNTLTVRYVVATILNGVETWWSISDRTMTVVNSNPTFSNFECEDINTTTKNLTGNNQKYIKKYSNLKAIISNANKMTAKNYATENYYNVVAGDKSTKISYSGTAEVSGTINGINSNVVSVYATDSRNNQTLVSKSIDAIDFTEILLQSIKFERKDGVGTTVRITGNGKYDNVNFGTVINTIKTIQYRKKQKAEATWGSWISIKNLFVINSDTGNFTATNVELTSDTFSFGTEYDVEVKVTDELSVSQISTEVPSGEILMDALKGYGVNFGGIYDEEEGGSLQADGKNILELMSSKAELNYATLSFNRHIVTYSSWGASQLSNTKSFVTSDSTKFTKQGSAIRIGAGITRILVSAISSMNTNIASDTMFSIRKNGNAVMGTYHRQDNWTAHAVPLMPVQVQEGDLISLYVGSGRNKH